MAQQLSFCFCLIAPANDVLFIITDTAIKGDASTLNRFGDAGVCLKEEGGEGLKEQAGIIILYGFQLSCLQFTQLDLIAKEVYRQDVI